jgi:hypothetical protein
MRITTTSSGASRHLLPQEREKGCAKALGLPSASARVTFPLEYAPAAKTSGGGGIGRTA